MLYNSASALTRPDHLDGMRGRAPLQPLPLASGAQAMSSLAPPPVLRDAGSANRRSWTLGRDGAQVGSGLCLGLGIVVLARLEF